VDAKVAYERTKNTKHRPLLGDQTDRLARIETLLRERQHLYKAIPNRVDTSAMSVEQQTDEILRIYKQQQAG
jgi:shikimate kinase